MIGKGHSAQRAKASEQNGHVEKPAENARERTPRPAPFTPNFTAVEDNPYLKLVRGTLPRKTSSQSMPAEHAFISSLQTP